MHRQPGFDKITDLHLQRAFENATCDGAAFQLDAIYNAMKNGEIAAGLLGVPASTFNNVVRDLFNSVVFACINIKDDGLPEVDIAKLQSACAEFPEGGRQWALLEGFGLADPVAAARKINKRLQVIRLKATNVIVGEVPYNVGRAETAIRKIESSAIAQQAFGDSRQSFVAWLRHAA